MYGILREIYYVFTVSGTEDGTGVVGFTCGTILVDISIIGVILGTSTEIPSADALFIADCFTGLIAYAFLWSSFS